MFAICKMSRNFWANSSICIKLCNFQYDREHHASLKRRRNFQMFLLMFAIYVCMCIFIIHSVSSFKNLPKSLFVKNKRVSFLPLSSKFAKFLIEHAQSTPHFPQESSKLKGRAQKQFTRTNSGRSFRRATTSNARHRFAADSTPSLVLGKFRES